MLCSRICNIFWVDWVSGGRRERDLCQIKGRTKENGATETLSLRGFTAWLGLLVKWTGNARLLSDLSQQGNHTLTAKLPFLPRIWMKEVSLALILFLICWGHLAEKQEIRSQFSPKGEEKSDEPIDHTCSWSRGSLQCSGRRHLLPLCTKLARCKQEQKSWESEKERRTGELEALLPALWGFVSFLLDSHWENHRSTREQRSHSCMTAHLPRYEIMLLLRPPLWFLGSSASLLVEWCSCNKEH